MYNYTNKNNVKDTQISLYVRHTYRFKVIFSITYKKQKTASSYYHYTLNGLMTSKFAEDCDEVA